MTAEFPGSNPALYSAVLQTPTGCSGVGGSCCGGCCDGADVRDGAGGGNEGDLGGGGGRCRRRGLNEGIMSGVKNDVLDKKIS